jgi:hypothetical protein
MLFVENKENPCVFLCKIAMFFGWKKIGKINENHL